MVFKKLQLITLFILLPSAVTAEIYQWRDAQGRQHFSDRVPEQQEGNDPRRVELRPSQQRERLLINELHSEIELSSADRERMQQGIRHIFQLYTQRFGLDIHGQVEVNLHLFSSRAEYQQWVFERIGEATRSTGIFLTQSNEVGVWDWGTETQIVDTILHEASHVILHQLAPNTPIWLHEGLAQYFQTIRPDGERLRIEPIAEALLRIRQWIADDQLISVRHYLNIPQEQWQAMAHNRNAIPYTLAWGLVYFMMSRPVGEQTIRRILHDLEKSGLRPTLDSINDRYPGGIASLEYDFFRWAQEEVPPHWH